MQDQFPDIKKTDQFHITLQFLGDDIESADTVIDALKSVQFKPFEIEMGDAMPFGNQDNPRGVWIECKINDSLQKLSDDIQKAMKLLGFISDFPFKPHITLGRYKIAPQNKPEIVKGEPNKFSVETFYLIKSTLTTMGSSYEVIGRFS